MPRFEPFRALRYNPATCSPADVTSPPYDVLSGSDRAALVARSPHNAVLVDLPVDEDGPDRYRDAGRRLRAWQEEGVLVLDDRPTFTAYRMSTVDELGRPVHTLGVLGALELSGPDEGQILPHEHTTKKAKSDRLDLLRGTRANLSAIWGLSLTPGLTDLLGPDTAPEQRWEDPDGVTHETWKIVDHDQVEAIAQAVRATQLVVADGHHRYETSLAYRDERARAEGTAGAAASVLCYVVELSEEQLTVRAIHRLVDGFAGTDLAERLCSLPGFTPAGEVPASEVRDGTVLARLEQVGGIGVVGRSGTARLLAVDRAASTFAGLDDLDSSRLAAALDQLGEHTLRYQHGSDRTQEAVMAGEADWGVLIRPVTVAAIEANAHSGRRMPPKSTFFHPKPLTGIVFRPLD